MATYLYETIPQAEGEAVEQFEIRQSMSEAPLARHPETGRPIRRVIVGGYGILKTGASGGGSAGHGHSCGPGCHHG